MAEKLNVVVEVQKALQYEEFLASISRRCIDEYSKLFRDEVLQHARKRANELLIQLTRLRELYVEQDNLLGEFYCYLVNNKRENMFRVN